MSSELRRFGPWVAWALAALVAVFLNGAPGALGNAPAQADVREAALSSPRPARVVSVGVRVGQAVSEGQVLARLDSTELEAELVEARTAVERQRAQLEAKGIALKLDRAKIGDREATQTERLDLEVVELETAQHKDQAQLTQLAVQIDRQRGLVEQHLASVDELNKLELERVAVQQKVDASAPTLQRARLNAQQSRQRLVDWRGGPGPEDPRFARQLLPEQLQLAQLEAKLRHLEQLEDLLALRAPYEGTVASVDTRLGEVVRAGRPVVTVVDRRTSAATAFIDESWAGQVRVGDEVELIPLDKSTPVRKARVTALGPAIVQTPERFQAQRARATFSREAHVELEGGPATGLMPGQAFTAAFSRGAAPQRLVGVR